eukprot:31018-Pelagococcus_subviridis.AAC.30
MGTGPKHPEASPPVTAPTWSIHRMTLTSALCRSAPSAMNGAWSDAYARTSASDSAASDAMKDRGRRCSFSASNASWVTPAAYSVVARLIHSVTNASPSGVFEFIRTAARGEREQTYFATVTSPSRTPPASGASIEHAPPSGAPAATAISSATPACLIRIVIVLPTTLVSASTVSVRGAMACVARVCAPATAATRVVRGEKPDVAACGFLRARAIPVSTKKVHRSVERESDQMLKPRDGFKTNVNCTSSDSSEVSCRSSSLRSRGRARTRRGVEGPACRTAAAGSRGSPPARRCVPSRDGPPRAFVPSSSLETARQRDDDAMR